MKSAEKVSEGADFPRNRVESALLMLAMSVWELRDDETVDVLMALVDETADKIEKLLTN